jgi:hypothetical protein
MITKWLYNPYLNLAEVATKLYGSNSRMYTGRLRKKMTSEMPFEPWEIQQLEKIKQDILHQLQHGQPA